jgi:murein DD-endopeptidase MepM/ murein hydrolase activator NlpD
MSYSSSAHSHRPDSGRHIDRQVDRQVDRPADRQPDRRNPRPHRQKAAGDYTLVHAGKQVRLGPVAFWVTVGSLVVMAAWSVLTGTYFAFQDDVLTRLIARQAQMQFAYEDRISDLRAQVDRITSRQLLDQEQFEQKLDQLVRRQATLESRTASLAALPDTTPTGSIKPAPRGNFTGEAARPAVKPSPINDTVIFVAPPDREARLESRALTQPGTRFAAKPKSTGLEGMLARLQQALDRVETRQASALNAMEESFDSKARRMRGVLADLGLDPGKTPALKTAGATGGPFIPLSLTGDHNAFERQVYRINFARSNVDKLTRTLAAVPVRKPVFGEIDMSSPFGVRMDPFVRGPAIHSGVDMRGDTGDPVRATATGTVTVAGVNGGYGKMVEIDHGSNLTTRYGHLSAIDVTIGQSVKIGQIIGKIGSTGRSTGPHLHYETRVDGDAVDPQKFLRAGIRLGSL